MNAVLLLVAVMANFAPEVLPIFLGGSDAAWAYVCFGIECAALWCLAFLHVQPMAARLICSWGIFEALQRPVCRLAFPMDHAVKLEHGQNLCDAAYGLPMGLLSIVLALFLAALVQEVQRARTA